MIICNALIFNVILFSRNRSVRFNLPSVNPNFQPQRQCQPRSSNFITSSPHKYTINRQRFSSPCSPTSSSSSPSDTPDISNVSFPTTSSNFFTNGFINSLNSITKGNEATSTLVYLKLYSYLSEQSTVYQYIAMWYISRKTF